MLNSLSTYKESFLLDREFIVEYNIIVVALYIPAIIVIYESFPFLQVVNM